MCMCLFQPETRESQRTIHQAPIPARAMVEAHVDKGGASGSKQPGMLGHHMELDCPGLSVLFPRAKGKFLLC